MQSTSLFLFKAGMEWKEERMDDLRSAASATVFLYRVAGLNAKERQHDRQFYTHCPKKDRYSLAGCCPCGYR